MRVSLHIFKHFLVRTFRDPMAFIFFLLMPIGLIVLNLTIMDGVVNISGAQTQPEYGYEQVETNESNDDGVEIDMVVQATMMTAIFMLSFQFFSADILTYNVFDDLRGNAKWRLQAAPVPMRKFYVGAALSSWVFNLIQAAAILGVASIFYEVHWGSWPIVVGTILLTSIIAHLIVMLLLQFANSRKLASGVMQGLCFGFMALSGILFVPLGNSPIARFIQDFGTPLGQGINAIGYGGAGSIDDALGGAGGATDIGRALQFLGVMGAVAVVLLLAIIAIRTTKRGNE